MIMMEPTPDMPPMMTIVSAPSPSAATTGINSGITASNAGGQKRRRQWASAGAAVSLALYVVFWLERDNPHGAALPRRSSINQVSSLRKALFRMIGTVVGAAAIVVLAACFPQNRIGFLMGLAAQLHGHHSAKWRQWPAAASRQRPSRWVRL